MIDQLQRVIFPGALVEASRLIRESRYQFDCRDLLLPDLEPNYADKMTDEFARGYMTFKHSVVAVLQPTKICEIGVGSGISALAFLAASPRAAYFGIDNGVMDPRLVTRARVLLAEHGYQATWIGADSQRMHDIPGGQFDFMHVDGCHLREATHHDVLLSWDSLTPNGWILVDDARDTSVSAGVFDALSQVHAGSTDWAYFEDTWTGSILIHKETARP